MRTVIVKLDPQGIADAIEQINAYRKEVEDRTRLLCQRMVDLGAAIARIKIIQFDNSIFNIFQKIQVKCTVTNCLVLVLNSIIVIDVIIDDVRDFKET